MATGRLDVPELRRNDPSRRGFPIPPSRPGGSPYGQIWEETLQNNFNPPQLRHMPTAGMLYKYLRIHIIERQEIYETMEPITNRQRAIVQMN